MKLTTIFTLTLFIALTAFTTHPNNSEDHAIAVFQKVSARLNSLKTIRYKYLREFNYPSEGYKSKSEGMAYFDFTTDVSLVGFRYQYTSATGLAVFNGSEAFSTSIKNKTLSVTKKLKPKDFEGRSMLYNSIVTLRNSLPAIIDDTDISKKLGDTTFNHQSCYLLNFTLNNKLLSYLGTSFTATTINISFDFNLVVSKRTFLPLALLQVNPKNNDLNRTDFVDLDTNPSKPTEQSWYYSTYLAEYPLEVLKEPIKLIAAGQQAPNWQLANFDTKKIVKLEDFKGKVVLMEFFIKNCGPCIASVPKLNALKTKYASKNLEVLALNTSDSEELIATFKEKHALRYDILYGDDEVTQKYGVRAYPTIILIDKTGKIVYTEDGFDQQKLEEWIAKSI